MNIPTIMPHPTAAHRLPSGPKRILIVDDDVGITRLLKINLDQTGRYLARIENDPDRALEAARDHQPHLILLDVMMPHTDGGDLARMFREDPNLRHIPIVFLTGTIRRPEVDEHKGIIGGFPFIAKPVDMITLLKRLNDTLDAASRDTT